MGAGSRWVIALRPQWGSLAVHHRGMGGVTTRSAMSAGTDDGRYLGGRLRYGKAKSRV
jgi:hypothetical protein